MRITFCFVLLLSWTSRQTDRRMVTGVILSPQTNILHHMTSGWRVVNTYSAAFHAWIVVLNYSLLTWMLSCRLKSIFYHLQSSSNSVLIVELTCTDNASKLTWLCTAYYLNQLDFDRQQPDWSCRHYSIENKFTGVSYHPAVIFGWSVRHQNYGQAASRYWN